MVGNHAHTEAALLTILGVLCVYGVTWLFAWHLPSTLFGLPAALVIAAIIYVPLYFFSRKQWMR